MTVTPTPRAHVLAAGEKVQPGWLSEAVAFWQPGAHGVAEGGCAARLRRGGTRTPHLGFPGDPAGLSPHFLPLGSRVRAARRDRCSPQWPAACLGGLSPPSCLELTRCSRNSVGSVGVCHFATQRPSPRAV